MVGDDARTRDRRAVDGRDATSKLRLTGRGVALLRRRWTDSTQWKDKGGERQKDVCYIDVTVWSRQAEIAKQYLNKGRQVFVEGRLEFLEWEQNGQRRSKHVIVAERVQFLDREGPGLRQLEKPDEEIRRGGQVPEQGMRQDQPTGG